MTNQGLSLELTDSTQYATIYRGNVPVATIKRRLVADKTGHDWTVYATDGAFLFATNFGTSESLCRRTESALKVKGAWDYSIGSPHGRQNDAA